jgi:hypothetical protein
MQAVADGRKARFLLQFACAGSFLMARLRSDQQKESYDCHYVVTLPTQIFGKQSCG